MARFSERVGVVVSDAAYQTGRGIGRLVRAAHDAGAVVRAASELVSYALRPRPEVDADGAAVPSSVVWPEARASFVEAEVTDVPVVVVREERAADAAHVANP